MTISAFPARQVFDCAGTTGPYPVQGRFLTAEDLAVTRITADGGRLRLTLGDDYTVEGAGEADGGQVATTAAYADGWLEVALDLAIAQPVAYTPGDAFPAAAHEAALDRLTLIAAQLDAAVSLLDGRVDEAFAAIALGGGGGGGGSGITPFAFEPDSPAVSLAHRQAVSGQVYPVAFFDADRGAGSAAYWSCFAETAAGEPGARSHVPGVGLVMEGVYGRFRLLPGSGGRVDIRAAGVKCDAVHSGSPAYQCAGGTIGQTALIHAVHAWCSADRLAMTGGGMLRLGAGEHLSFAAPDSQTPAVSLYFADMPIICDVGYDGWMVTAPGNARDAEAWHCDLYLLGDNKAWAGGYQGAARGLKLDNDGGALGTVRVKASNLFQAVGVTRNLEDKDIEVFGEYCDWLVTIADRATFMGSVSGATLTVSSLIGPAEIAVGAALGGPSVPGGVTLTGQLTGAAGGVGTYSLNTSLSLPGSKQYAAVESGSPDDCRLLINGHNCRHWLFMPDGCDSILDVTFNVQNRVTSGDGIAAVQVPTGKNFALGGVIRGHNGPEDCVRLTKDHGVSAVHFRDLVLEHGHGCALNMQWAGRVSGTVQVRDFDDAEAPGATVFYGRIANAGGLSVTILAGAATWPARVGDDTWFPIDADLGRLVTQRGSPEPYIGTYPTAADPQDNVALYVCKGRSCRLEVDQADGHVKTDPGLSRFNLGLPAGWLTAGSGSYRVLPGHVEPDLQLTFRGACYGDDVFDAGWLFDGVSVEKVVDQGSTGFDYADGAWRPRGRVDASAVMLGSITSRENTALAYAGAARWDATNGREMFKSGPDPADSWFDAAGGHEIAPAYQAATEAFCDAIAAAGGTEPPDGSAEKRGIDVAFATNADAGYAPTAMYWWGLSGAYADAGRAAVRLNMTGAGFNLTEHGYDASWSGVLPGAGYRGNGTDIVGAGSFYLTGGPAAADVAGQNSLLVLWNVLDQPTSTGVPANHPDFSSPNGYLRGKFRHDAGGHVILNNNAADALGYSDSSGFAPCMRAGVRYAASGAGCVKGFANDRVDVTAATASAGAFDALEFFRYANGGAPQYSDRALNFFVIGPEPSGDAQVTRLARGYRRALRLAGKRTW